MAQSGADLDVVLIIDGAKRAFGVRGGVVTPIADPDPSQTVTLTLSGTDLERVQAGSINAQQLLHIGALRIGGRLDSLQAASSALAALGVPNADG